MDGYDEDSDEEGDGGKGLVAPAAGNKEGNCKNNDDDDNGGGQAMAATKRAMVKETRVTGNEGGNSEGSRGNDNGDKGDGR